MFRSRALASACALLALAAVASAADPMAVAVRVLVDNDKVRVRLLSFSAGYQGSPQFAPRADQLIVYLDAPRLEGAPPTSGGDGADRRGSGSVSWLSRELAAGRIRVLSPLRAIDVEFKHGSMSSPDPQAASLPYEATVGGGAPARTLIDNDTARATLISFPKDFVRAGNLRRRYDTLIVYIDEGRLAGVGPPHPEYAEVQAFSHHPDGPAVCDPIKDCDTVAPDGSWSRGAHVPGSVAWHPKDGFVGTLRAVQAYRALYIELK
jgi:hypothetical protein